MFFYTDLIAITPGMFFGQAKKCMSAMHPLSRSSKDHAEAEQVLYSFNLHAVAQGVAPTCEVLEDKPIFPVACHNLHRRQNGKRNFVLETHQAEKAASAHGVGGVLMTKVAQSALPFGL